MQEPEHIPLRITEYLSQVVGKDNILENIITPYGYHLDFVISFDSNGNIVTPDSTTIKRRYEKIPTAYLILSFIQMFFKSCDFRSIAATRHSVLFYLV